MPTIVNGRPIEQAEIDAEVERLRPHYEQYVRENQPDTDTGEDQLRQWARENVVERTLIQQAAREMDVQIPPEQVQQAYDEIKDRLDEDAPEEQVKADIELQMRIERLMTDGVGEVPQPDEAELRAYYDSHLDEMTIPEQVRASHIVKHVHGEADRKAAYEAAMEIRMRIAGGESFEDLAVEHSDCPDNAGDLGLFGRGQMVQEFEDVVFAMRVGEISDVFETPFGYHIVKLYEHHAERVMPFQQVRDRIAQHLVERKRQEAVEAFVDSLRQKATIVEEDDPPATEEPPTEADHDGDDPPEA